MGSHRRFGVGQGGPSCRPVVFLRRVASPAVLQRRPLDGSILANFNYPASSFQRGKPTAATQQKVLARLLAASATENAPGLERKLDRGTAVRPGRRDGASDHFSAVKEKGFRMCRSGCPGLTRALQTLPSNFSLAAALGRRCCRPALQLRPLRRCRTHLLSY